jgi:hypothetical protein
VGFLADILEQNGFAIGSVFIDLQGCHHVDVWLAPDRVRFQENLERELRRINCGR